MRLTVAVAVAFESSAGAIDAVMPVGSPVNARVTTPLKPPTRVSETVIEPLDPCCTNTVAGFTARCIAGTLLPGPVPLSPLQAKTRTVAAKGRTLARFGFD